MGYIVKTFKSSFRLARCIYGAESHCNQRGNSQPWRACSLSFYTNIHFPVLTKYPVGMKFLSNIWHIIGKARVNRTIPRSAYLNGKENWLVNIPLFL